MNITVDINALKAVTDNLPSESLSVADLGGFGTFYVNTDDNAMLSVYVTENHDRIYDLYSQLSAMQGLTKYVYLVIIGTGMPSQLLAVQEMGVFTVNLDSYQRLTNFVKFIANPKRRTEKKVLPARNVRTFTPAEIILMQIPGLGEAKVGAILQQLGSLAMAMQVLSWYDADEAMPGVITKRMAHDWREIIGISDGYVLITQPLED